MMIARIDTDTSDAGLAPDKLMAGLALAFESTKLYTVVPLEVRDSLARTLGDSVTYQRVADSLGAELIVFASVARIANLIRSELVIAGGDGFTFTTNGHGYGVTYLQSDTTGKMIYDPAILSSMQRALCIALRDSSLYATADEALRIRPAALLCIGGVAFAQQPPDVIPWSTFKEKVVASFDLVQTMIAALRFRDDLIVIDTDTRDSIYAKAGLYLVENYNPVSSAELTTLRAFDIDRIITGRYQRKGNSAELTLYLQTIGQKGAVTTDKKATSAIADDTKLMLQDGARAGLRELLGTISEPPERKP
ncbi:MAG: hypothetical protein FGM33_02580 [Candidatus Kapabacteria bacterium]|nr:hypothetical protein [Candidatus Kapabacteria bacterium]